MEEATEVEESLQFLGSYRMFSLIQPQSFKDYSRKLRDVHSFQRCVHIL